MPTLAIRLDPTRLSNADADLRYVVPDRIAEASGGTVRTDGYDYDGDDVMTIFFDVDAVGPALAHVRRMLEGEAFLGNELSDTARLFTAGRGRGREYVGGLPHLASVSVLVDVDDSPSPQTLLRLDGEGFVGQGAVERVGAVGYVALAAARAVWEAVGVEPPAAAVRGLEAAAFSSWSRDPSC